LLGAALFQGSTELWEWDKYTMAVAQELHDIIIRELISKYEVGWKGDYEDITRMAIIQMGA